ncbi:MAG: zinc ribbon domain-containing protein [bacterium]
MAIKIECSQCGFKNDLGRIFCTQCGQKLDMSRTAMADMQERREFEGGKILGKLIGWFLLLGVLACVGLALWPESSPVVLMEEVGFQQVPLKLVAVKKALAARQRVSVEFGEGEVNGYLLARAGVRNLTGLTVDFKPGVFELRARQYCYLPLTKVKWLAEARLPVSYGLTGAFEGGRFVVKSARFGHLPLIGPAIGPVKSFFARVFNDVIAEKDLVDSLTQVDLDSAKADLSFGK